MLIQFQADLTVLRAPLTAFSQQMFGLLLISSFALPSLQSKQMTDYQPWITELVLAGWSR